MESTASRTPSIEICVALAGYGPPRLKCSILKRKWAKKLDDDVQVVPQWHEQGKRVKRSEECALKEEDDESRKVPQVSISIHIHNN